MKVDKAVVTTYTVELSREDYEHLILAVDTALLHVESLGPGEAGPAGLRNTKFGLLGSQLKAAL